MMDPDFTLLEPDGSEALAFRLLCEAWWMNRSETDPRLVNKSTRHNGIIVHAPTTPDRWFGPFVEDWDKLDASRKREAVKNAPAKIGEKMGDAKVEVTTFLKSLAVLYDGNRSAIIGRLEFEAAIAELLKKVSSTVR